MTKAKQKGSRIEREYMHKKEAEGYVCIKTVGTRFGDKDFFNLFDIIGFRKDGGFLAQVKSNQTRGVLPHIQKWADENCPANFDVILAVKYDRGISKKFIGWREIICAKEKPD